MGTLIQKYHFVTDAEGWTSNVSTSGVIMGWRNIRGVKGGVPWIGITAQMGGYLATTYRTNDAGGGNHQLTTTWDDFGVPSGSIVTDVTAEYYCRWDFGSGFWRNNVPIIEGANQSGPLALYDFNNALIGSFSDAQTLPTSALPIAGMNKQTRGERHYPDGTGSGAPHVNNDIPVNWLYVPGGNVSIPTGSQSSDSTVTFRLTNAFQAIDTPSYVRLKQDRVVITATYSAALPTIIHGWGIETSDNYSAEIQTAQIASPIEAAIEE